MNNREHILQNTVTVFTCPPKRLLSGITEMSLFTRCRRACAHMMPCVAAGQCQRKLRGLGFRV